MSKGTATVAAAVGLSALACAVVLVVSSSGHSAAPSGLVQVGGWRQEGVRAGVMPSLAMTYPDLVRNKIPASGRCRCTGVETATPSQRVVCACSGPEDGDVWDKGPWKVVTGYPVVVDKKDEDPKDYGKYVTVQAMGYPDGPKKPPHWYTLVQPWDSMGAPTMDAVYPDATQGVPSDAFFEFETPAPKGMAFSQRAQPELAVYGDRGAMLRAVPQLGALWRK